MRQVNMLEAKTQLSKLVDAVERGTEKEVIIARNGRPAVRLVPLEPPRRPVRLGLAAGKFSEADIDALEALDDEVARLMIGRDR